MAKDAASDNPDQGERRAYVTLGLAELLPRLTRPAYKKRSPAGALLMSDWEAIVGPRLAEETQPKRFSGSTLTIACSGPMAMELQHLSGTLIERINVHAGRKLVERLRFVQEPVAARPPVLPRVKLAPEPIPGLPPGDLNDALARLRAAIRAQKVK
jgi:hypothetical protein